MPVLTIDNRVIEVPEGANVLEAAELLGKSQPTIRAWIKKGKLKAKMVEFSRKYGRRYYRYRTWFILRNSLPTTI